LSGDAIADQDVELDDESLSTPVPAPAACSPPHPVPCNTSFRESPFPRGASKSPSISAIVTDDSNRVPGVKYSDPMGAVRFTNLYGHISIAKGTTFRIRRVVESFPIVEVERDSSVPCDAGESRCGASKTCLADGFDTCAYCDGSPAEVCECLDSNGALPDGTVCVVGVSGSMSTGTCAAGTCKTE
jgi:hypothetical protein